MLRSAPQTPSKTKTYGLYADGKWKCNCVPRASAPRRQVGEGKSSSGRWYYICKNYKQDNGCKFFLWEDEPATQKRMKHGTDLLKSWAVTTPSTRRQLSSIGRTPSTAQHSPQKPAALINHQLSTPQTTPGGKRRFRHLDLEQYNTTPTKTRTPATSRYALEWLANDDDIEDPESFVTAPGTPQGSSSSPSKQRRTTRAHTSPSKTKQRPAAAVVAYPTLPSFSDAGATTVRDEDIFTTPQAISGGGALSSRFLGLKPARGSLQGSPGNAVGRPMLAREVLQLLDDNDVRLTDGARMALTDILVVHAKRYEGVVRGRDIAREALKKKDLELAELRVKVEELEAQRLQAQLDFERVEREKEEARLISESLGERVDSLSAQVESFNFGSTQGSLTVL